MRVELILAQQEPPVIDVRPECSGGCPMDYDPIIMADECAKQAVANYAFDRVIGSVPDLSSAVKVETTVTCPGKRRTFGGLGPSRCALRTTCELSPLDMSPGNREDKAPGSAAPTV